jgi:nicotinate-nucleotide adenylyltransferase
VLTAGAKRLGVMGGMFDPVHLGHLQLAQAVRALCSLDEVKLVPCGSPVHRPAAQASSEERLRMLALATVGLPWLTVDPRECRSTKPSYTFDTVAALRREQPAALLFLVVGLDAFLKFHTWHRWQELLDMVQLVVASRPGYQLELQQLDSVLQTEVELRLQAEAGEAGAAGRILMAELHTPAISSTVVRARLRSSTDVSTLLPAAVAEYIKSTRLYENEDQKLNSSELRDFARNVLEDMKGQDIVCMDIKKLSTIADYMLVVTGTSTRHVKSMADELVKRSKADGIAVRGQEGEQQAEWVLIDLGDVVVHVMQASVRKLYDLETLWNLSPPGR